MYKPNELKSKYHFNKEIDITDLRTGSNFVYIKMKIKLNDSSVIFVKEYNSIDERKYSYHWQDHSGKMLIRWNNAPHHKTVETFPHHLHKEGRIESSKDISLNDVLESIANNHLKPN
ncbi:MAG: hypothetical protein INQ03_21935 [Candidatus Heimdallarchaeota archaeon]|nr:hypothetical protein [Candidatus Heimdallarchaeota archaeon]